MVQQWCCRRRGGERLSDNEREQLSEKERERESTTRRKEILGRGTFQFADNHRGERDKKSERKKKKRKNEKDKDRERLWARRRERRN